MTSLDHEGVFNYDQVKVIILYMAVGRYNKDVKLQGSMSSISKT